MTNKAWICRVKQPSSVTLFLTVFSELCDVVLSARASTYTILVNCDLIDSLVDSAQMVSLEKNQAGHLIGLWLDNWTGLSFRFPTAVAYSVCIHLHVPLW